jgi:hypothetical protein
MDLSMPAPAMPGSIAIICAAPPIEDTILFWQTAEGTFKQRATGKQQQQQTSSNR